MRGLERIEQELAALNQAVAAIAQEFHDTYKQYLAALGPAVRQQLILASYHVCTHGYPERFLALSLSQRQALQQQLRQLSKQAETDLNNCLHSIHASIAKPASASILLKRVLTDALESPESADSAGTLLDEATLLALGEALDEAEDSESDLESGQGVDDPESSDENLPSSPGMDAVTPLLADVSEQPVDETIGNADQLQSLERTDSTDETSETEPSSTRPITPKRLVHWQGQVEDQIGETLQTLSHDANRLLQKANILSKQLPEPVLEVAAKADLTSETTASPPNLLSLLVETESNEAKEATMTQVMAIRLRLSEIEFSDQSTSLWRSKIRSLLAQLSKLGREYQKKEKERAVAQAEAAWRSSWFED